MLAISESNELKERIDASQLHNNETVYNDDKISSSNTNNDVSVDNLSNAPNDSKIPPCSTNNETNDIQHLYKDVNLIQSALNTNIDNYIEVWKLLNDINNRVFKLDKDFSESTAEINGRVLVNEIKLEEKGRKDDLKKIHSKINCNQTEINKIKNYAENVENIERRIKLLNDEIEVFKNINNNLQHNTKKCSITGNAIDYSSSTVKCEYLFITDSNLKNIKPDIMNPGSVCQKVFAPTFNHIHEYIDKVTVVKAPNVIFFHCGTNCIDVKNVNEAPFLDNFEDYFLRVMESLKNKFPHAKIVVSSILPRKETLVNDIIPNLNDFLLGCCSIDMKMSFMNNVNVKSYMLYDNKHVNFNGFRILLSNIRYTLFGKYPSTKYL